MPQCYIVDSQKRIVHRPVGIVLPGHLGGGVQQARVQRVDGDLRRAARGADRELYDVLSTSMGARATAADARHLDGRLRPPLDSLGALQPREERAARTRIWIRRSCRSSTKRPPMRTGPSRPCGGRPNPALGDFRSLEDMRIAATRAQEIPAQENIFRRLYLNQWTEQADRVDSRCRPGTRAPAPLDRAALARPPVLCRDGLVHHDRPDGAGRPCFPAATGSTCCRILPAGRRHPATACRRDRVPYDQWAARRAPDPSRRATSSTTKRSGVVLRQWRRRI